jgi:hypothetical protein
MGALHDTISITTQLRPQIVYCNKEDIGWLFAIAQSFIHPAAAHCQHHYGNRNESGADCAKKHLIVFMVKEKTPPQVYVVQLDKTNISIRSKKFVLSFKLYYV